MQNPINFLDYPIVYTYPKRLTRFSAWHGHIPFAMFLVEILKPKVIVELGTHYGDSYCAFCQAVQDVGSNTQCYAIDTWKGDIHAGFYGDEVFADLRAHHDPLYGHFSQLVQSTFDGALNQFADSSIDLLHIDGCHTYDAVKHDYESWLPKMSSHGVILFHDTQVKENKFGVWRLWEEVSDIYPHFEFTHGYGLGVLVVGEDQPDIIQNLVASSSDENLKIGKYFYQIAKPLVLEVKHLKELSKERNNYNKEVAILKEKVEQLEKIQVEKELITGKIKSLEGSLEKSEKLEVKLEAEKELMTEKIKSLESSLEKSEQMEAKLEAERETMTGKIKSLESSLEKSEQMEAKLKREMDHLKKRAMYLNSTLENIVNTKSWKLTAPIRFTLESLAKVNRPLFYRITRKILDKTSKSLNPKKSDLISVPEIDLIKENTVEFETLDDAIVSVVIPTKNAGDNFQLLLKMLNNQRGLKEIEIVVVDSGSTDETLQLASEYGAKIINIPPESFTHSYSRNLGAENAGGVYLLFTVQDALPPSDTWLYELIIAKKKRGVVAVSCAESPRENADLFYRVISWNHYKFLEVDKDDRILSMPDKENYISMRKNGQLSDVACLIPKAIFMNYKYESDYAEDLDLGMKLIKDGHKIAFLSSIRVIHSHDRPAYYFLKRGYVDNIFLSDMFHDFPISPISLHDLGKSMVLTYYLLDSLLNNELLNIKTPCGLDNLKKSVSEKLKSTDTSIQTISINFANNEYVDDEFKSFLENIFDEYKVNQNEALNKSTITKSLIGFTITTFRYMEECYESVDDCLLEDFKYCIFKIYALLCGAQLANCYKNGLNDGNEWLNDIHVKLIKGV